MLVSLSIRDVVLIERLDLSFGGGLSVFTGETGAGKSILLDSLSLALGARAESGLVRHGATQLTVVAEFDPVLGHPARRLLTEQDIEVDGAPLVLRRVVTAEGRSRAHVNDQPVSIGLLRRLGAELVEIHGQFESHGLLSPETHPTVLDAFAGAGLARKATREGWKEWQRAAQALQEAEAALTQARAVEEDLRYAFDELSALNPKAGEESELSSQRTLLRHGEKLMEAMTAAMAALVRRGDVPGSLRTAQRTLERVLDRAEGRLAPAIAALDRASAETAEAVAMLEQLAHDLQMEPGRLEKVEERLFALRAMARKHGVGSDELEALKDRIKGQLASLDGSGEGLVLLARAERTAREDYIKAARTLSRLRSESAQRLDVAVAAELAPLKLGKARFHTQVDSLAEPEWGPDGVDRVEFMVSTNPGAPPGALGKIASGGELARFMLALKVVLARISATSTIVFDEVDAGIGGAVAAAVGDRLARLGSDLQVLVVTHSPQVAARGRHHYRVVKREGRGGVSTSVETLKALERREEVARMLAGEVITEQARAAADSLLGGE